MSRSPIPARRALALAAVLLLALLAVPALIANAAAHDNNVQWTELGHNSRDPLFRSPGGAAPTGTAVRLRLRAADGDLTAAQVRVWDDRNDQQTILPMTRTTGGVTFVGDSTVYEFWEVTLPAPPDPTIFYYRFIAVDGGSTAYYEDDNARTGGWGQTFADSPDNSWQLTYYDPAFQTPDWVKNAVIYQIYPDRFRDGNSANNPAAGEFFYGAMDTIVRSNTTDWNARICDPRDNPDNAVECLDKYSQNFYGGDLQGIIDKLDYIEDLGVTALYLNPIFESPSNHKYDTKDFMVLDDNFGDLALYQTLVAEANNRGMHIIVDGVFNHSSSDSRYFDRYSRWDANGAPTTLGSNDGSGACEATASPYASWYHFTTAAGTPLCAENRDYESWWGYDSLPKLQSGNPAVRNYFIGAGSGATSAVGPYWIDQGAGGWRLDVGADIDSGQINDPGNTYWEEFREAIKSVDPDAYIVGEEWGNATSWTVGGEWDAVMNYQFAAAVLSFWRDETFTDNDFNSSSSGGVLNPLDANGVTERLLNLQERYAPEAFAAMMNLFNSHDTNRVLFLLNHDADQNNVALYNDPNYDWSDSISRYKGALIMQMTLPGAPTIYYGDEVGTVNPPGRDGSTWQDDPYNRAPFPWLDQSGTPFYAHMQSQTAQDALSGYVAQLTGIRNDHEALRTGSFHVIEATDDDILVFVRRSGGQVAVVMVNKSDGEKHAVFNARDYVGYAETTDLVSGETVYIGDAPYFLSNVIVPAHSGRILIVEGQTPPATVSDLTATAVGANQIDLDWSPADNANWYDIYRSRLSGGGYDKLTGTPNTDFTDTDVDTGVTYYYVVVAATQQDGVISGWSNEDSATPFIPLGGGWRGLQWPATLNHTASATLLTDNIFGQIWVDGVTNQPGATPGLLAEVGYGDTNNTGDGSWQWYPMTFNVDVGNNDEFMGNLPRAEIGTFCYTTRYSGDGGNSWYYAVNGPNDSNPTCPGPFGVLTVTTGSDTTAPAAPTVLAITGVTSASITLGWNAHPNTDGDLYAFRVYRGPVGGPYTQIAQVVNPAATSYVDTTVAAAQEYEYYITAIDDSVNESAASNLVSATAENLIVDVTFQVTVPSFTFGTVYLVGGFGSIGLPNWDPGAPAMAMTETSPNVWEITLQILDGTQLEYKYARGSWDKGEKQANGFDEVNNRPFTADYGTTGTQLVADTVANWRDRIVVDHFPADGATGVAPDTVISVSWNKWMPTPPTGTFSVTGPGGAVSGEFTWDNATNTHTFWPYAYLAPGEYTVLIENNHDGGDNQFLAVTFSFTVPAPPVATEIFVTATGGTVDSIVYKKYDILRWDDSGWSKWFDGAAAGLNNRHDIDAIAVGDGSTGEVYMTFAANRVQLPGSTNWIMGQDVVYYDGANWSLYIDGSDMGLTTVAEKIDSLEVIPAGAPGCEAVVLLSTQGNGRVNGLGAIRGADILSMCLIQSGENTQFTWLGITRGQDVGMPNNATVALSMPAYDADALYFLTRNAFNVGGVSGGHSTVYGLDTDAMTFSGPHWRAADHGLRQKTDSLDISGPLP